MHPQLQCVTPKETHTLLLPAGRPCCQHCCPHCCPHVLQTGRVRFLGSLRVTVRQVHRVDLYKELLVGAAPIRPWGPVLFCVVPLRCFYLLYYSSAAEQIQKQAGVRRFKKEDSLYVFINQKSWIFTAGCDYTETIPWFCTLVWPLFSIPC